MSNLANGRNGAEGPERGNPMAQPKIEPKQGVCYSCGKPAQVLFKGEQDDPNTWVTNTCDVCLDQFCAKCCEWDEILHKSICLDCFADYSWHKHQPQTKSSSSY